MEVGVDESENKLSPEEQELENLFRLSFRYSQGLKECQNFIFEWVAKNGYLPDIEIPKDPPDFAKNVWPPSKHVKYEKDQLEDQTLVRREIRETWDELYRCRGMAVNKADTKELEANIFNYVIFSDAKYQSESRAGREIRDNAIADSEQDGHASFLRRYVILGKPTGNRAYDELFKRVGVVLEETRKENNFASLTTLEEKWEKNHPGEIFYQPAKNAA